MNKRQETQWRRTPVVAYHLEDGQRLQADSITELAGKIGVVNGSAIGIAMRANHVFSHEWFVCKPEEEGKLRCELDKWIKWHAEQRGRRRKKESGESAPSRVPLRIDARTVIYVKPENANERYAEQYRKRVEKSRRCG